MTQLYNITGFDELLPEISQSGHPQPAMLRMYPFERRLTR